MKSKLTVIWDSLKSSYWFVPGLMCFGALAFAFFCLWIDGELYRRGLQLPEPLLALDRASVRALLTTIAGAMFTAVSIVFSMTMLTLVQASSQLGPRLLTNFMRDRTNQFTLGAFLATFLFCLVALRGSQQAEETLSHLTILFALLMTLLVTGQLIHFVHHVAQSINASLVVAQIGKKLTHALESDGADEASPNIAIPAEMADEGAPLAAAATGYIKSLDYEGLIVKAKANGAMIRLERGAGDFVRTGDVIGTVWPMDKREELEKSLKQTLTVGRQRTLIQDTDFYVEQLVEVAVRSLSPGINDPFTAVRAIDWLSAALARLAALSDSESRLCDDDGTLRVLRKRARFEDYLAAAFNQIRQNGADKPSVAIHLLRSLAAIDRHIQHNTAPRRRAILRQAHMIAEMARSASTASHDREDLEEAYEPFTQAHEPPKN